MAKNEYRFRYLMVDGMDGSLCRGIVHIQHTGILSTQKRLAGSCKMPERSPVKGLTT